MFGLTWMSLDEIVDALGNWLNNPVNLVVLGLLTLTVASQTYLIRRLRRRTRNQAANANKTKAMHAKEARSDRRDVAIIQTLALVAGTITMSVSAGAMLRFFAEKLGSDGPEQWTGFAIFEVLMLACAFYARFQRRHTGSSGPAGKAVWAFAFITGLFASLDAHNFAEALFRFFPPMATAFMFELVLNIATILKRKDEVLANPALAHKPETRKRLRWNFTSAAERVLVRWGWIELDEDDRDMSVVARQRQLSSLSRAAARYHTGSERRWKWLDARMRRKLDAQFELANERLGYATNKSVRDEYDAMLHVLYTGRAESSPTEVAARVAKARNLDLLPPPDADNLDTANDAREQKTKPAPEPRKPATKSTTKPAAKKALQEDTVEMPILGDDGPLSQKQIDSLRDALMEIRAAYPDHTWDQLRDGIAAGGPSRNLIYGKTGIGKDRLRDAFRYREQLMPDVPDDAAELDQEVMA